MSGIGKRALVTSTVISALVGTGLAIAPSAEAATSSTMSTNAYKFANSQRGKAYVMGTEGLNTYDCSGLTWRSYQKAGKNWARTTADAQRKNQTVDITVNQRRVGDLIFFKKKYSDKIYDHVGIYAGSGYMIDAQTGSHPGVIKEKVNNGYWNTKYVIDYRRVK